jgi:hypothetical protein
MHADERVNALGQASGSAEVAAQSLAALRRALAGKELRPNQKEALKVQADMIDLMSSMRASDTAALAAMLVSEGSGALRNLSSLRQRLALHHDVDDAALGDAREFLRSLASDPQPQNLDRHRGERAAAVCKEWLTAALDLVGSATRETILPAPDVGSQ